jgi:MFS transporter, PAT family, beta-lactamase induction signal transducer AmpG
MRAPRPWHFFFLVLPYGVSFGFVSVALPYVARERGIGVEAIGAVVAAAFAPHAWKFLWAPIVDTTLTRKAWYLIALGLVALGTFASMAMPITASSLGALTSVVVASQVGLTLLYMACEGTLGRALPKERKSTAAAWLQSGTYLGLGVGGGLAIELVTRLPGPLAGGIIAVTMLACALPLLAFDEPAAGDRRSVPKALRDLMRDLGSLIRSRSGVMAIVLCLSTVGAGAASNLFGALADDWHASRGVVELTNGWLGGIVSAGGALVAGWIIKRVDRRLAYAMAGALTAATGIAMALAPHVSLSFAVFTLAYGAFTGMAAAAYSAFAFETIGSESVATKYNILASLVNLSVMLKTPIESHAHGTWGGGGVLLTDAAITLGGIVLLAATAALTRPARR